MLAAAALVCAGPARSALAQAEPGPSPSFETVVHGPKGPPRLPQGRATSRVGREELEERLPRSTPDALRYEPGVFVQQTGHGQASAYVRGRTGQQTVLLFDGVRLNTSTFRQGPNQYFFTVDARTVQSLEVLRGGASTLYGSDAIGGVLQANPIEPTLRAEDRGWRRVRPAAMLRYGSADGELGGRVQLDLQLGDRAAFVGGTGYRRVGALEGGGLLRSRLTGEPSLVPRLAEDGRTQLGTGFRELASDGRLAVRLGPTSRLVAALYDYRQFDAPRTDQCPPAYAPRSECLRYEEQYRTLGYLAYEGPFGRLAPRSRAVLSYQLQHERRAHERPYAFTVNGGRDDVHTLGLAAQLESRWFAVGPRLRARVRYGADLYHDWVASTAWTLFSDLDDRVIPSTRGQYLDGARYLWGGGFAQGELGVAERLWLRVGGRASGVAARASADRESGSRAVNRKFGSAVGHLGLEWQALYALALFVHVDRSFRAPNLDDLTSRQQTGPGFQLENPALDPEHALTVEAGLRLASRFVSAELWGYWTGLADTIERAPRSAASCPPSLPQCAASWSRFQLVNLDGWSHLAGAEAVLRVTLPFGFAVRTTLAYAVGEGPSPLGAASGSVPLSRVPPLNGTAELRYRHRVGLFGGAGLRWALAQSRLSLGDQQDVRIPAGGTPGFAVLELRAGYRFRRHLLVSLLLENLGDAVYRYHGSSVNGPGRSVTVNLEGRL